jgi:hypothetical protein
MVSIQQKYGIEEIVKEQQDIYIDIKNVSKLLFGNLRSKITK